MKERVAQLTLRSTIPPVEHAGCSGSSTVKSAIEKCSECRGHVTGEKKSGGGWSDNSTSARVQWGVGRMARRGSFIPTPTLAPKSPCTTSPIETLGTLMAH